MTLILSTETIEAMRIGTERQRLERRVIPSCVGCGSPAELSCTHSINRYVRVYIKDLRQGERVCRHFELAPKPGSYAVVSSVRRKPATYESQVLIVEIVIHRAGKPPRQKQLEGLPMGVIRAERAEVCQALVCENCAQDPGDETRYCPDHWTIRTLSTSTA